MCEDLLGPAIGSRGSWPSNRAVLAMRRVETAAGGIHGGDRRAAERGEVHLLNRLAERDVAIVSRSRHDADAIEVALDLRRAGRVVDTAGVRESRDPIEAEGVKRALERAASADLVLWLTEANGPSPVPPTGTKTIAVRTKADLVDSGLVRFGGATTHTG